MKGGGDISALVAYAYSFGDSGQRALGGGPVERQAFKEALFRILDEGRPGSSAQVRDTIDKLERLVPAPPLTAPQQREAEALAQQVVEAHRRRSRARG